MKLCNVYFQPKTIKEALSILKEFKGKARVIAGGTDLIIDLKKKKKEVDALVDLSGIEGLNEIRFTSGKFSLGAMVTHAQVFKSELIQKWAPVLSEACSSIGSPQIRNMGTLVGNVVNAMPAADGASALIALDSKAKIVDWEGRERIAPLHTLYRGVGESLIDSSREIALEIEFSIPDPPFGSSFQRLSRRKALSLPILNVAVFVKLDRDASKFEEVRIILGPVAPIPFRPAKAERFLLSSEITEEIIKEAAQCAAEEATPRDGLRGGSQYRKEMIKVLVKRALYQSLARAHPKFEIFFKEKIELVKT